MAFKTLLTHVGRDQASTLRLQAAAALAGDLGALLIGLAAEAPPPYLLDSFGVATAQWLPVVVEEQAKAALAAHHAFREQTVGVHSAWLSSREPPTQALARHARAADLIVVGGGDEGGPPFCTVKSGELLVTAGRPLLVAPINGGRLTPRRILIAWKDTRESRRAVADALPFLLQAESITIVALCGKGELDETRAQAEDVAGWLKRQGAAPPLCQCAEAPSDLVDAELLAKAEAMRADLVVAGGYGHSRAAEWLVGGVTHTLLRRPDLFVFLSH